MPDTTAAAPATDADAVPRGSPREVFAAFLKLGLTAFGGPVAHLGYFRSEFVERRRWLDDRDYSDLVALCQFLPGPASSQVGLALGLGRAGWRGGLAAWLGFAMPSAVAMILFAEGVTRWAALATSGVLQGLKVVAVAVVAQAVWAMAKALCRGPLRAAIAVGAALVMLAVPSAPGQLIVILLGGLAGGLALSVDEAAPARPRRDGISRGMAAALLAVALLLLVLLPLAAAQARSTGLSALSVFYTAGALVFGGGHVVLPLLQAGVVPPGWVSNDHFLAGYGAVQALPGPLFTFAAYLGAVMPAPLGGWHGGLAMLLALFLPGLLLVAGSLPFWEALRRRAVARRALAGVNAAVVGLLAAALYDPVWTSAIHTKADVALAVVAFALLRFARLSPVVVVLAAASAGWAFAA